MADTDVAFDIGEEIRLRADFTDGEEQPGDPSELEITVVDPDGTVVAVEATQAETGIFEALFTAEKAGRHWWRCYFVGDRAQVEEDPFFVRWRRVPEEGSS